MGNLLKGSSIVFTKGKADSFRPILRWIKADAPRKREREQASRILREIEGIKDWKQVILSRGEAELLNFIATEFPEGARVEEQIKQLELFPKGLTESACAIRVEPKYYGTSISGEIIELPNPPKREKVVGPKLKKVLTSQEQEERDSTISKLGYKLKPDSYWDAELKARGQERK